MSSLRPGVMICTPSLHDTTPENAETFLRWTKLHNRELLDLPATDDGGKITRCLRFARPHSSGGVGDYFYTILTNDIPFFHSAQYHACSRRLDLENTRVLGEGEESVGCEEGLMVWDICDAKFAIYEEVASSDEMEVEAYPELEGKGKKWLVGASLAADESRVKEMQKDLVECLRKKGKVFSSVYKHGGKEAQPDKHPEIEARRIGGGEWLVVVLVVGEEGMMEKERLEELVEEWKKEKEGVNIGVWKGEVDML